MCTPAHHAAVFLGIRNGKSALRQSRSATTYEVLRRQIRLSKSTLAEGLVVLFSLVPVSVAQHVKEKP
jgi:hypothetical protein